MYKTTTRSALPLAKEGTHKLYKYTQNQTRKW